MPNALQKVISSDGAVTFATPMPTADIDDFGTVLSAITSRVSLTEYVSSIEDAPSSDTIALAKYIYGLYYAIFFDVSDARVTVPFAQHQVIMALLNKAHKELRTSKDRLIQEWLDESGRKDEPFAIKDLDIIAARVGLQRIISPAIYYTVLAVYEDTQKDYWSSDTGHSVWVPGRNETLAPMDFGIKKISSVGIPSTMPKFWKWMNILFYDITVLGEVGDVPFANVWRNAVLAMMRAARPLNATSYLYVNTRAGLSRSAANVIAALYMTNRMGIADARRDPAEVRLNAARGIASAMFNIPYKVVDADWASSFVKALSKPYHDSEQSLFDPEDTSTLGYNIYEMGLLYCTEYPITDKMNGPVARKFFGGLEALDESSGSMFGDLPSESDESDDTPETGESDEDNITAGETRSPKDIVALAGDGENLNDYMYKSAFLRMVEDFEAQDELGIKPEIISALKDWCLRWLWLLSIDDTKKLVSTLGLGKYFEPLSKEELLS